MNLLRKLKQKLAMLSLKLAIWQQGLVLLVKRLREIEPDISKQETSGSENFNAYWELKRRSLQAFQCHLMLKAIEPLRDQQKITVVDIGDSAGTHMLYLKELTKGKFNVDPIGVNLDPVAVEKIKARGQKAVLCRAEDLDLGDQKIDLFTSFEMVEHLFNPAIFFRRLAKKTTCQRMLITIPYQRTSRVGLYNLRYKQPKVMTAEEEHIFELSPSDWSKLLHFAGWKVVASKVYYQYPRWLPLLSFILSWFWRKTDFEGFWGAILEKDVTVSDYYKDWEE